MSSALISDIIAIYLIDGRHLTSLLTNDSPVELRAKLGALPRSCSHSFPLPTLFPNPYLLDPVEVCL